MVGRLRRRQHLLWAAWRFFDGARASRPLFGVSLMDLRAAGARSKDRIGLVGAELSSF